MEYFEGAIVNGVPLLFVVIGLVQWSKQLGLSGKGLIGASMGIGLVLGAGFQIATAGLPADFGQWFGVVVYGLGLGIVASGVYDAAEKVIRNGVQQQ